MQEPVESVIEGNPTYFTLNSNYWVVSQNFYHNFNDDDIDMLLYLMAFILMNELDISSNFKCFSMEVVV